MPSAAVVVVVAAAAAGGDAVAGSIIEQAVGHLVELARAAGGEVRAELELQALRVFQQVRQTAIAQVCIIIGKMHRAFHQVYIPFERCSCVKGGVDQGAVDASVI